MTVIARVPSLSKLGTSYAIRQFSDGLACDCPAFDNHAVDESTDKHIAIYKAARHALRRCADAGHVNQSVQETHPRLCQQCLIDLLAASSAKVRRRYVTKDKVAEVKAKARATVHDIRERAKRREVKR